MRDVGHSIQSEEMIRNHNSRLDRSHTRTCTGEKKVGDEDEFAIGGELGEETTGPYVDKDLEVCPDVGLPDLQDLLWLSESMSETSRGSGWR